MYDDAQYANSRLVGTIVRDAVTGVPTMVHECYEGDNGIEAFTSDITKERPRKKRQKLKDLNIASMPLGYINVGVNSYYVSRIPKRNDWRQGIRDGQLSTRGALHIQKHGLELMNMLENKYPPLKECFDSIVRVEANAKAFSRVFAAAYNPDNKATPLLLYKGMVAGVINKEGVPELNKKYQHLKERLERFL